MLLSLFTKKLDIYDCKANCKYLYKITKSLVIVFGGTFIMDNYCMNVKIKHVEGNGMWIICITFIKMFLFKMVWNASGSFFLQHDFLYVVVRA